MYWNVIYDDCCIATLTNDHALVAEVVLKALGIDRIDV